MVKVYFESNNHAELVAIFATEELSFVCLQAMERMAGSVGMTVTESVEEESLKDLEIKKF